MREFVQGGGIVFDLGMNNGDDTAHYLRCGFSVLAVEANPVLCAQARDRFQAEIAAGRVTVLQVAIAEQDGTATFFVNLDNDHWSSLDPGWAGRDGTATRETTVEAVTLETLVARFGAPHFLKVDVEGVDRTVIEQVRALTVRPRYVSVEDCRFGPLYLEAFRDCGYDSFKLLDQSTVPTLLDPYSGQPFPAGSSGPCCEAVPGPWLSYEDMVNHYHETVRDRAGTRLAPRTHWWDIHCTYRGDQD